MFLVSETHGFESVVVHGHAEEYLHRSGVFRKEDAGAHREAVGDAADPHPIFGLPGQSPEGWHGADERHVPADLGKEDQCPSGEEAIVIEGSERGTITSVCRDKECPKHGPHSRRAVAGNGSSADVRKKHRIEKIFRQRLFSEIRKKVQSLPGDKVTRIVARAMWRRVGSDSKRALLKASGHDVPLQSVEPFGQRLIEKAKPVELGRILVSMSIAEELMVPADASGKAETMLKLADVYGVDLKTVREGLKAEAKSTSNKQRNRRKSHAAS